MTNKDPTKNHFFITSETDQIELSKSNVFVLKVSFSLIFKMLRTQ